MAMNDVAFWIGLIILGVGGVLLTLCIIGLLAYFTSALWVVFSERFRDICKAESLSVSIAKTVQSLWRGKD